MIRHIASFAHWGYPAALLVLAWLFAPSCGPDRVSAPVYDATCTDVATQALERCTRGRAPCGGIYGPVYQACRTEVDAGRAVHLSDNRFVPGGASPVCDCSDAVAIAVSATEDRCSQVLDCKNVDRHPDTCGPSCKYHALEDLL